MRVATSSSPAVPLAVVERPSPALRPKEVRVRVVAIGVNPVDWKMRQGGPLGLLARVLGPRGSLVVGIDFAGEVVEVGSAVTELRTGARVVGGTNFARGQHGSYADEVVVRPDQCAELPPEVSYESAACLPVPGATAWLALTTIGGLPGKTGARVLVLGASGGVGISGVQLAKMLGARVVGVSSAKNAHVVASSGGIPIDYAGGDALERARAHGPFDVILNAVGSATYANGVCRTLLAPGGVVVLPVVRVGDAAALAFTSRVKQVFGRPASANLAPLVAALARGDLRPVIEDRLPLADAEAALVRSRAGKVVGKVLLMPRP